MSHPLLRPGLTTAKQRRRRRVRMLAIVRIALNKPYTFVVLAILIVIFGVTAAVRTPIDIFPTIGIPVVAVVWTYDGLPAEDMSKRVIYYYERTLSTQVNDIEHIEFAVDAPLRGRQGVLSARRQHQRRAGPDDGGLADCSEVPAARDHASLRPQLQRLQRPGYPARAVEQVAVAGADLRLRPELHPSAACLHPRFRNSLALRRQDSSGPGGRRPGQTAGLRPLGGGCRRRDRPTEHRHACRHRKDRRVRICRQSERFAGAPRRTERFADPRGQRRDGFRPRRRLRAFRRPAADQHGAGRRRQRGPDDDPEERLGVDAGRHQRGQGAAAEDQGIAAPEPEGRHRQRPVVVRLCGRQFGHLRGSRRGGADRPDDPDLSRQLALDPHHHDLDSAGDPRLGRGAVGDRRNHQRHDAWRPRARGRHPGRRRDGDDREHQLASRAGQGHRIRDHGRRPPDRPAGDRVAALHLHRLRADVQTQRRRRLSVPSDGRSGDLRARCVLCAVADPGQHDGSLPARAPDAARTRRRARRRRAIR